MTAGRFRRGAGDRRAGAGRGAVGGRRGPGAARWPGRRRSWRAPTWASTRGRAQLLAEPAAMRRRRDATRLPRRAAGAARRGRRRRRATPTGAPTRSPRGRTTCTRVAAVALNLGGLAHRGGPLRRGARRPRARAVRELGRLGATAELVPGARQRREPASSSSAIWPAARRALERARRPRRARGGGRARPRPHSSRAIWRAGAGEVDAAVAALPPQRGGCSSSRRSRGRGERVCWRCAEALAARGRLADAKRASRGGGAAAAARRHAPADDPELARARPSCALAGGAGGGEAPARARRAARSARARGARARPPPDAPGAWPRWPAASRRAPARAAEAARRLRFCPRRLSRRSAWPRPSIIVPLSRAIPTPPGSAPEGVAGQGGGTPAPAPPPPSRGCGASCASTSDSTASCGCRACWR